MSRQTRFLRFRVESIHGPRRINERRACVDRHRHATSFRDLFARGAILHRCIRLHDDAAVALPGHGDGERNQLAPFRMELVVFAPASLSPR